MAEVTKREIEDSVMDWASEKAHSLGLNLSKEHLAEILRAGFEAVTQSGGFDLVLSDGHVLVADDGKLHINVKAPGDYKGSTYCDGYMLAIDIPFSVFYEEMTDDEYKQLFPERS